jgi:hypothetical protein
VIIFTDQIFRRSTDKIDLSNRTLSVVSPMSVHSVSEQSTTPLPVSVELLPELLRDSCCFSVLELLGLNGSQVHVTNKTEYDCYVALCPEKQRRVELSEDREVSLSIAMDGIAMGNAKFRKRYQLVKQISDPQCYSIAANRSFSCNLPTGIDNNKIATLYVLWHGLPPGTKEVKNLEMASASHFQVLGGQRVKISLI